MAHDPIATRYAQAAFEAAKAAGQVEPALEQLALIGALLRDVPDLRQFLWNPGVDPEEKVGVLGRALKGSWSELIRAFVRMVISMGRAEHLGDIAEAFQAAVDEDQGRLRAVVRSARPLPEAALTRLRARLEHRERKRIELTSEIAPELLGGVQVRLGHRVIDGSIRRQLSELRQQLMAVRVH